MKKRVVNKQKVFVFISILFLSFCIIFYGFRFIYYYRKFNRKTESGEVIQNLTTVIRNNNEITTVGDGLYSVGSDYIFKGVNVNNYLKYSGLIWRIVKINSDNSITLVTEESMNEFMYGNTGDSYDKSQIRKWLNNVGNNTGIFYKILFNPDKYLKQTTICLDKVSSLSNYSCNSTMNDDFVGLLGLHDYTNSLVDEETYLNINDEYWLSTVLDSENAYYVNGSSLSKSPITDAYGIRPVITLNYNVAYESGKGTKDEPYIIGFNDTITVGNYVKLGTDLWIVYEVNNDNIRLALDGYYNNSNSSYRFGSDNNFMPTTSGTLAYYLNNDYLNSLSYKDLILTNDWYIGEYNKSLTNIYETKVNTKVGLYNIADIKLHNDTKNYYLLTKGNEGKVYGFDMSGYLFESATTQNRFIKPAITINKTKTASGVGTKIDPYILEG